MKSKFLTAFLILSFVLFTAGCNNTVSTDYDLYIFNTKGENADAMDDAAKAYEQETGKKVKVFSLGSGTNTLDTLRAEMNSKNKPGIFSIANITELAEWEEGGFALDLSNTDNAEFNKLHDSIPENMRLTSDGAKSYGIPYNVEGYGYITDTRMIASLIGNEYVPAFLEDLKTASYADFERLVLTLDDYIKNNTEGKIILNGTTYPLLPKSGLSEKLTGVFSVAGSEKWTYGDHMINVALASSFETPADARTATEAEIDAFLPAFKAYARALDLKTSHAAGASSPLIRGAEFINTTTSNYDASVQIFADGKAVFLKQGNWVYTNIAKANSEIVKTLTFIPIKLPLTQADIKVNNLTVQKLWQSIPVYVPNYYAINAKADEAQQKEAMNFLVWLNTTESGIKFIKEDMAFIPYNANPDTTVLNNSLGNSILEYMKDGDIISNPYAGTPATWTSDILGLEIMENYLTKDKWDEEDYDAIAKYGISKWKELRPSVQ